MDRKKITLLTLFLFFGLFMMSFVNAAEEDISTLGTIKKGECISLYQYCPTCSYSTVEAIKYPDGTIDNSVSYSMDKTNSNFNYTFCDTNQTGDYFYTVCGDKGNVGFESCEKIIFETTSTGRNFSTGQGITSTGILVGALLLSFLFMFLGIRIGDSDNNMAPLGFFFIALSIFLGIYSLNLGYSFTSDILQYESLTPVTSAIYISFLWLITGVAIISVALMLISFIKQLITINKTRKFGDDFNPLTDSYE